LIQFPYLHEVHLKLAQTAIWGRSDYCRCSICARFCYYCSCSRYS